MAQTIADLMVSIGADMSDFEKGTKEAQKSISNMSITMSDMARTMGKDVQGFSDKWKLMSDEMKEAYKQSKAVLEPFKKDLYDVEFQYFKLAKSMSDYKGTNKEFINEVGELGKRHKKITDEMMKNNDFMKTSFIESVGSMLARSTQSEKIAQNFDRMNNPLYKVNNGLLNISKGMEEIAKRGQPAHLALKMLGPTANMKELNDMTRLINAGLLRFTSVALIGAVGAAIFYGALHDAASSVPGYTESFETMLSTMREAFQPMVDVFAAIMTKIYDFITVIGELMIKFNEAHPFLAKILQGFLLLIPALILILSPLAVGIGLWSGLAAGWAAMAPLIMPLITGLMSIAGTVAIVAAALVAFGVVFYLLWTKVDWFREGVTTAWNNIVEVTQVAWNWVLNNIIKPIINAIVSFGQDMMTKFAGFWDENGAQILDIVMTYFSQVWSNIEMFMGLIKGIFQIIWPIISGFVEIAWNYIELVIGNGIDIVLGLIEAGLALLRGDWDGAWNAILGIAEDIWHNIEGFFKDVDLFEIGANIIDGLLKGLGSMAGAIADKVASLASLVPDGLKDFLGIHSPSRLVASIMKWVPIGAAKGIDDNLGHIEKSAEEMSKASVPSLSDAKLSYNLNAQTSDLPKFESNKLGDSSDNDNISKQPLQLILEVISQLDGREVGRGTHKFITEFQELEKNRTLRVTGGI